MSPLHQSYKGPRASPSPYCLLALALSLCGVAFACRSDVFNFLIFKIFLARSSEVCGLDLQFIVKGEILFYYDHGWFQSSEGQPLVVLHFVNY